MGIIRNLRFEISIRLCVELCSAENQPLFLYLPFQSVHSPLQAPEEYLQLYEEVEDEDRRTYLAMVTAMDDVVGNVTESLKEAGLYENSVIIWFSDNGGPLSFGASNFPLRGEKVGFHFKLFQN